MMNFSCETSLKYFGIALLAVSWASVAIAENETRTDQPIGPTGLRTASLIHSYDLFEQSAANPPAPVRTKEARQQNEFWQFPEQEVAQRKDKPVLHLPAVVRLPPAMQENEQPVENSDAFANHQIATLLPPRAISAPPSAVDENFNDLKSLLAADPQEIIPENESEDKSNNISAEEQEIIDAVIRDSRAVTTGVMTEKRVNELAKTKIRQGYVLASRGAYYAARQQLIEVLRIISLHNDAQQSDTTHTLALAAGLRALEEADDFAPRGTQLEADLAIEVICASHRTPVARQLKSTKLLPRQMMDCYFRYAQLKLAAAVEGEPAGSMALHALGKLTSRLNKVEPEKLRLAHRRAVAYQQAALLAHNQNHLAAHELAVLLADSGHYAEAEQLLLQVIPREPNAIVYRNLAQVQEKMGQLQNAEANRIYAQQLIRQGAGGNRNVRWVSPENFVRSGANPTRFATAPVHPAAARQSVVPATNTSWR